MDNTHGDEDLKTENQRLQATVDNLSAELREERKNSEKLRVDIRESLAASTRYRIQSDTYAEILTEFVEKLIAK